MADIEQLAQQADQFSQRGDLESTARVCREILALDAGHIPSLRFLADLSLQSGNLEQAEQGMRKLLALKPQEADLYSQLGQILYRQKKLPEAVEVYQQYWQLKPRSVMIHLALGNLYAELGDIDKAAQLFSLAEALDGKVLKLWRDPDANPGVQQMSKTAWETLCKHHTALHVDTVEALGDEQAIGRIRDAVWPLLDEREVRYAHDKQNAQVFYIQYPQEPYFYERESFGWCEALEAQFEDLRAEILQGLDVQADGAPYLGDGHKLEGEQWAPLVNTLNWASVHLYSRGVANPKVAGKFPKTEAALKQLPLATFRGNPMEVFISVLAPNTHIPEHYGVSSAILTVHLPISVPEGCGLKVNTETRVPEEGKILAFDDTWEHSAWNNSDQQRVVLIFELWNPQLSEIEKEAVLQTFYARDDWLQSRSVV
ncbi:MAG: aspartyl/asparaginyl beta-hydroxylase domain-containing protein [Halieaceae bacterium]